MESFGSNESLKRYSSNYMKPIEKYLINKYFRDKILDLGCGCGRTTKYLYDLGHDVIGVEIVESMVKKAKSNLPKIKFEVGDACNLRFKDNAFDAVFFSFNGMDFIHPELARIDAIKEISRILKPGGYFIFSSHNPLALFFNFRPRFLLRNLLRGTLFSRYKYEKEKFGELCTYYASPQKQILQIHQNTNLRFVELVRRGFYDIAPHYVFKKR